MSRRTRVLALLVSTPLVVLVLVGGLLGAVRPLPQQGVQPLRVFDDVVRLIFGAYVEPASVDTVMDGAMHGLADSLDAATSYLTPDEVRLVESGAPIPPGETGLTIDRAYWLRVIGVEDGSPAARAGLRTGDLIRAIDERPTRDVSVFAGDRLLHGPVGSKVSLLVVRNGNAAEPRTIELVREGPRRERAAGRLLPTGEAYVRVSSFEAGAADAIASAISSLPSASTGVVIDLRGTADGPASEGIAAARLFISNGVLATRASRHESPVVTRTSAGDGSLTMPVVLLVSNGTANAAEVFAAALSDNKRAPLVGQPTAGMASVQRLIKLPEGHGLLLTTEQYTLADGTPVNGRGLRPNVPVPVPVVGFDDTPPTTDAALDRAREELATPTPAERGQPTAESAGTLPAAPSDRPAANPER